MKLGISWLVLAATALALAATDRGTAASRVTAPNWSGYAVTALPGYTVSFAAVTGTWEAPAVSCPTGSAGASSVVWVGIGGYGGADREVAQIGTGATCTRRGRARHRAWFELAPNPAFPIANMVRAGDTIHAAVTVRASEVDLAIENETRHWRVERTITWMLADTTSAEWIVEAPNRCRQGACGQVALANFHALTMTGVSATDMVITGTLANPAWSIEPIRLVPRSAGSAGAVPGPITGDGSGFSVSWVPVARP